MEKLIIWIAWKLPRRLVYWATIRVLARANNPFDTIEALEQWQAHK